MKERPILFSTPLVRANRKGIKTQTRRLGNRFYGDVGDRLWVRETWRSWKETCRAEATDDEHVCGPHCNQTYVAYQATPRVGYRPVPDKARITYLEESTPLERNPKLLGPWKPSIHMPRWASRDNLVITAPQREQRLLDITEEDALAEGIVELAREPAAITPWWLVRYGTDTYQTTNPVEAYVYLFRTINADKLNGEENPVVQVVTYRLEGQC